MVMGIQYISNCLLLFYTYGSVSVRYEFNIENEDNIFKSVFCNLMNMIREGPVASNFLFNITQLMDCVCC